MKHLKLLTLLSVGLMSVQMTNAATVGTLELEGEISEVTSIVVNPAVGVHDQLDLTTTQSDLVVGSVDEASNANTGYKILLKSDNAGLLKNGALDSVTYTLKYDDAPVTLSATDQDAKVVATGGVYSDTSSVKISYTGQAETSLTEGVYSDTLTFTIEAN